MNSNKVYLISRIVAGVIILISLVLWINIAGIGETPTPEERASLGTLVSWGYILVYIAIAFAVLSSIFSLITNPETIKGTVIGIVAITAVFGIAYGMSDGSDYMMYVDKGMEIDESTSRLVSTGLNSFIILAVLALLSVVYSAVTSIFK